MKVDKKLASVSGSAAALIAAGIVLGISLGSGGHKTPVQQIAPVDQAVATSPTPSPSSSAAARRVPAKPADVPSSSDATNGTAVSTPENTLPVQQGSTDAGGVVRAPLPPTPTGRSNPPPVVVPTITHSSDPPNDPLPSS